VPYPSQPLTFNYFIRLTIGSGFILKNSMAFSALDLKGSVSAMETKTVLSFKSFKNISIWPVPISGIIGIAGIIQKHIYSLH